MLEIYHAPRTRSIRVIWLCEELGLDHRVVPVEFSPAFLSTAEWRRLNPVGKVPVLKDGDLVMFESGAMVQYLLDRYGDGRLQPPRGSHDHARFLQWCWFAEATFARPLGEIVNHRRVFSTDDQNPAAIEEMQQRAALCVQALDDALAVRPYLLGDEFSAADIMTGYTLMLAEWLLPPGFPDHVADYWRRLSARPAYRAAMGAGA